MSMKADCMPGSTRTTRPMTILPTSPRDEARSICTSCVTPCSITATRVSCGVTLTRISSVTAIPDGNKQGAARPSRGRDSSGRDVEFLQQLDRFRERQAHDAGVASRDPGHECAGAALDSIRAGLVERLAACAITPDL